jgi:hypothetical protein
MNRHERRAAKKHGSEVTHVGLNSHEFLTTMTATCADVLSGRISPTEARAIVAEQRKILKMFELQQKFGRAVARRIERGEP